MGPRHLHRRTHPPALPAGWSSSGLVWHRTAPRSRTTSSPREPARGQARRPGATGRPPAGGWTWSTSPSGTTTRPLRSATRRCTRSGALGEGGVSVVRRRTTDHQDGSSRRASPPPAMDGPWWAWGRATPGPASALLQHRPVGQAHAPGGGWSARCRPPSGSPPGIRSSCPGNPTAFQPRLDDFSGPASPCGGTSFARRDRRRARRRVLGDNPPRGRSPGPGGSPPSAAKVIKVSHEARSAGRHDEDDAGACTVQPRHPGGHCLRAYRDGETAAGRGWSTRSPPCSGTPRGRKALPTDSPRTPSRPRGSGSSRTPMDHGPTGGAQWLITSPSVASLASPAARAG